MSLRQDGTATVTRAASRLCTAKPRRSSEATASSGGDVGAAETGDALEAQRRGALPGGWRAGFGHLAWLAAAQFQHHRGGGLHRVGHQRGIDAALEALARVGDDLVASAGQRDADRIEQRALDEDRGGGFVAAGRFAADHAGHRLHAGGIGDGAVLGGDGVVAAVQRAERLAAAGPQRQHVAGELRHVEHVQRAAEVDGEEVGDVHQRVDRPQADRRQPILQPLRARSVAQVADGAAEDPGAGLGPVDLPARAAAKRGRDLRRLPRLQRADAGGGEVARDAAHARSSRRGSA